MAQGTRIAVPLVRSVGWLSRDDLWVRRIAAGPLVPTPGAQCIGERMAEYAIFPHQGDWHAVYEQAYNFITPITAARADTHAGIDLHDMNITRDDPSKITYIPFPRAGELPASYSFVQVEGEGIVLTALRHAKNGHLLIRFFNINRADTIASIRSIKPFATACQMNLNEDIEASIKMEDAHQLNMPVRAGQIVTVGLTFGA